ncbi:hypothetical protein [Cyclobacterium plantarum]|uniref:DUF4185 domain-containing protein n=1 Tax=Cyclobacterium plantarum TaxID=2716263 RepID=A0ABX0H733_9BACT|nr:hypothetical protein [Cyclobacterium plantarum]NHE56178.1 hypothetical protein [Cyclobacterium plantarum]
MKIRILVLSLFLLAACGQAAHQENAEKGSVENVLVIEAKQFDYVTWKINAANGTWHFEKRHAETGAPSTGFNSAIDEQGLDWISNNCVDKREWRGWPNFASDGFGHPCRGGGGSSYWIGEDGKPIDFADTLQGRHMVLASSNEKYKIRYHFFPSHAAIEVLEANDLFAFLWEGPVGGEMDIDQQYYVLEDGVHRKFEHGKGLGYLNPDFGNNFPSPFFYFVDEDADHILYVGAKGVSEGGDEGWVQPDNMAIFSFGRDDDKHALSNTEAVAVFGFLDKEMGHEKISSFIKDRLADPFKPIENL